MDRYLAHVTQSRLALSQWRFGQFVACFSFQSDERGERALDAFLASGKLVSVDVLLDLPDERFLPGSIPHVRGADARRLKYRALRRAFPDSDYCRVECQNRHHEGRRDDRILCSGFDGKASFESWFWIFLRHSVRVSRLYSPALLAPAVLRQLAIRPPRSCLLVTRGLAGLRQTLVVDGWTRFSRIFELDLSSPEAFWQGLEHEEKRARDYFRSHALLDQVSSLQTLVVSDPILLPGVRNSSCPDTIVASAKQSRLRGCEEAGLGVSDLLALRSLTSWKLPSGYPLQEAFRNFARQSRIRHHLDRAAVVVALVGVVMLAGQFKRIETASQRLSELERSVLEAAERTDAFERQIASHGRPAPAQMQLDVTLHRQLQQRTNELHEMLRVLSSALLVDPQVVVDALAWKLMDNLEPVIGDSESGQTILLRDVASDGALPRMAVLGHVRDPLPGSVVGEMKALQTLFARLERAGLKTKSGHSAGSASAFPSGLQVPADSRGFRFEVRSAL